MTRRKNMYDFKHQNNLNTYETYTQTIQKEDILQTIRNLLFSVVIFLFIIIAGVLSFNLYQTQNNEPIFYTQKTSKQSSSTLVQLNGEISHLALTKAITQSVVQNLQSQRTLQKINDDELKNIIQKVVNKIEIQPNKIKYSQN
jgi:hypothetical protein